MNQNNPEDVLLAVINKVLEFSGEGKQAKAQHILPFVYESVMQYPQLLWDNKEIWKIAKALLVMHHYDMIDDEDEEIKLLQMAFVFSQRAIELSAPNEGDAADEDYFHALHTQIMLLSSCQDYYTTTIADLCSKPEMTDEERLIANRIANRIIPVIAYNMIVKVDDTFEDFHNDSLLAEMCNKFELENPDITPKQLDDAIKIHKMLIRTYLEHFKK